MNPLNLKYNTFPHRQKKINVLKIKAMIDPTKKLPLLKNKPQNVNKNTSNEAIIKAIKNIP